MTSPTESVTAQLYRPRYSRTLLKIEILLVALVYCILIIKHQDYDLTPSFIIVTLISFIFFMRFSIRVRFPHDMKLEFRSDPLRVICYDKNLETCYLPDQIEVRMTRWFVSLKLGRYPHSLHLPLLADSFEQPSHYSAVRRFLSELI